jgi:hypothetical protein
MRWLRRKLGGSSTQLQVFIEEKLSLANSWATSFASLGQCWNKTLSMRVVRFTQSAKIAEDSPHHASTPRTSFYSFHWVRFHDNIIAPESSSYGQTLPHGHCFCRSRWRFMRKIESRSSNKFESPLLLNLHAHLHGKHHQHLPLFVEHPALSNEDDQNSLHQELPHSLI